jgi:hypothetical protein
MIDRFVDIDRIDDYHCLNFLFIIQYEISIVIKQIKQASAFLLITINNRE